MDQLNVKEQQEFQQIVEQKQMKDFMNLYSNLVSRCFDDCVNDFTSNSLTSKETSCIAKCSEKFLKHSERVGQRFQEQKYVDLLRVTNDYMSLMIIIIYHKIILTNKLILL